MTEQSFGAAAAHLCGAANALLGWRPDEFWNSTPAELASALGPPSEDAAVVDRESFEALRLQFPDE